MDLDIADISIYVRLRETEEKKKKKLRNMSHGEMYSIVGERRIGRVVVGIIVDSHFPLDGRFRVYY